MKKITIDKLDENIYYEKLSNGLEVYFYVNKNVQNNYATFTTKYGSIYNEFVSDNGKVYKLPNGVAHFLEHKVFVQKDGLQPEEFYGKSGAMCNAYTTFKNTTYLFSGIDNIYDNVIYLLDFVQNIYLTDENVESEKGIIKQEINMCDDRPSDVLYDKIRKNSIVNNPFKESIIGTAKEVDGITKEMLEKCYYHFYNPNNMILIVTGNFDMEKMLTVIKDNQSKKTFSNFKSIKLKKYNEPDNIVKKMEVVKCDTDVIKMAYSIKIPINKFNIDKRKLNIYMYLIFNLLFGDTSSFDEEVKKDGIITNTIYCNVLNIDTHFIASLISTGDKYEELIKRIDDRLSNIIFDEADFERKKKVLISNEIFSYDNIETIGDMILDNIIFDGTVDEDIISLIQSLNIGELRNIVDKIDFSKKSIVILKK